MNDAMNGVQKIRERIIERPFFSTYLPHMADKHIHCINFLYFFKLKKLYFPTAPNSNVIDRTNVACNVDTMVLLQVFFDVIDTTLGHSIFYERDVNARSFLSERTTNGRSLMLYGTRTRTSSLISEKNAN